MNKNKKQKHFNKLESIRENYYKLKFAIVIKKNNFIIKLIKEMFKIIL